MLINWLSDLDFVIPREACLLLNQWSADCDGISQKGITTAEVLDAILRDSDSDISDVDSGNTGTLPESETESDSDNHGRNVQPPRPTGKHFSYTLR